jgi:mannosyl-3-phosphoglycerate phosphatase
MLRDFLIDRRADPRFNTLGFGDMSLEEIMELTGLPREDAKRAMKRYASEPFLWRGESESLAAFRKEVAEANLRLMEGSRYMYLLGDTDKATAIRLVIKHLQKIGKTITRIIALGDSDNDREMLLMATNPVIIRHADGSHLSLAERPDAMLSEEPGPEGWNRVMLRLLAEFEGGSFTDEHPT